jgi:hypothetical protein
MGSTLVMFGGEDSQRHLMDDLNILDLESLTWEAIETSGTRPSSCTDHVAAVHGDCYLFLLGGSSHSSCYGLYVLDLECKLFSPPHILLAVKAVFSFPIFVYSMQS